MPNSANLRIVPPSEYPNEFFASVAARIEGFFYRCLNDRDYTMLRLTSGFDRVLGYSSADFVNARHSFAALIHPDELPGVYGAIEDALARKANWLLTYRLRTSKGRYVQVRESGAGVRDPKTGEVMYLDGVIVDAQRLT
jgi:PAS domain-containing protein